MEIQKLNSGNFTIATICRYCGAVPSSKGALKSHISRQHREQHKNQKRKPSVLTCSYCLYQTQRVYNLQRHQKSCEKVEQIRHAVEAYLYFNITATEYIKYTRADLDYQINQSDGSHSLKKWNNDITARHPYRQPVPIACDVTKLDWQLLASIQQKKYKSLFNVILMDPPWSLSIGLSYKLQRDRIIKNLPIHLIQKDGFLFMWIVNSKEMQAREIIQAWGYEVKDKFVWVKVTKNGKLINGNGVYLRHSEEICLLATKGKVEDFAKLYKVNNVIVSRVRGESVKPTEIYDSIEQLVPCGHYIEIYGRKHNLRNNWVTVGNQLEDKQKKRQQQNKREQNE